MKLKTVERLKMIQKRIEELSKKQVVIGSLGTARQGEGLTNAELLALHEFGSVQEGIPERPVMRTSFAKYRDKAEQLLGKSVSECLSGDISANTVYERMGIFLREGIRMTFVENDFVPNSPVTIARKKSSKPLIDTGALRASINYEVRDRE